MHRNCLDINITLTYNSIGSVNQPSDLLLHVLVKGSTVMTEKKRYLKVKITGSPSKELLLHQIGDLFQTKNDKTETKICYPILFSFFFKPTLKRSVMHLILFQYPKSRPFTNCACCYQKADQ